MYFELVSPHPITHFTSPYQQFVHFIPGIISQNHNYSYPVSLSYYQPFNPNPPPVPPHSPPPPLERQPSTKYQRPHQLNHHRSNSNNTKSSYIPALLVNTVELCRASVEKLMPYAKLAIDLEGISLSRTGRICIIQIATTTEVYLFDIEILKETAFNEGKLRQLLQSPMIDKFFYDARKDCEALYYQYEVSVENVCDLQILYTKYREVKNKEAVAAGGGGVAMDLNGFLPGLKQCFKDSQLFNRKDSLKYEAIKQKGHELFSPQMGGSFEHWAIRPLHPDLIQYCIHDVMLLYTIYSKCCHMLSHEQLQTLSMTRIQEIIQNPTPFQENHPIWRLINFQ